MLLVKYFILLLSLRLNTWYLLDSKYQSIKICVCAYVYIYTVQALVINYKVNFKANIIKVV